jgi:hypothetical protein
MFLSFGFLWRVGLLILGLWWCKEILGRFRDDLAELKDPDATRRGIIVGLWAVTAVIMGVFVLIAWNIIAAAVHAWNHPVG